MDGNVTALDSLYSHLNYSFCLLFYHPLSFAHIKLERVKRRNHNMRGVKSNIIENEVNKMKMLPFGLESKFIFYALMFAAQNTEG